MPASPLIPHIPPSPRVSRSTAGLPPVGLALTENELRILRFVAEGKTNLEIGKIAYITEDTVKSYLRRSMAKLNAINRANAVHLAHEKGLFNKRPDRPVTT